MSEEEKPKSKRGGYRPGGGRPSISAEVNSRMLTQAALIRKFGSLDKSLEYLLESGEVQLLKFVYEHAFGKPVDRVASTDVNGNELKSLSNTELLERVAILSKLING